jgi:catechol 2,3-dioxygenase-like lactoylglutathione lyase family enzyme
MDSLKQTFLMSSDLTESRHFYENAVGLEPREVGDGSVAYETSGSELKIEADFSPEQLEAFNLSPPADGDRGDGLIIVLSVDEQLSDIHERIQRELADSQGELLTEPREVPWGERMFLVRDPDGYVLEIRPPEQ